MRADFSDGMERPEGGAKTLLLFVIKRALQIVPLIIAVIVVNFIIIHLAPGSVISILVGEYSGVTQEYIESIKESLGLNKPLHEQLFLYLVSVLRGDLGYSFVFRQPVAQLLVGRMVTTLLLMSTGLTLGSLIGIWLGVISSKKPYSLTDNLATIGSLLGYSLPVFWLGQMLLLALSYNLGLFPSQGTLTLRTSLSGISYALDVLHHLFLPSLTLAISNFALTARLTRANMLEALKLDFVVTARSKGLPENVVLYRHALRNALLPVVTVIGMNFGYLLAGAVFVETVFGWPGMGRLAYEAILSRDYPVIMGELVLVSVMVAVANLVTDIVYAFLDPRIRYG